MHSPDQFLFTTPIQGNEHTMWRHITTLAALLHDIGKVGQRGEVPASGKLRKEFQDKLQLAPIDQQGNPYNTHIWWTGWWIQQYEATFKRLGIYGEGNFSLFRLACTHHLKWEDLNFLERLIVLADNISVGFDREEADRDNLPAGTEGIAQKYDIKFSEKDPKQQYKCLPLLSIWETVSSRYGRRKKQRYWHHPLRPLSLRRNDVFPAPPAKEFGKRVEKFKELWDDFTNESDNFLSKLVRWQGSPEDKFRSLIDTLLALIHKYFWCVVSSAYDMEPITSLYDHLKTTAAFAVCLYDWIAEKPAERYRLVGGALPPDLASQWGIPEHGEQTDKNLQQIAERRPFLLVGGDLSGIQSFIYDIYSSRAKKALKGRSFYLQLLTEVVIERILRALGYWRINVLFASGGKFYLILPNTEEVKSNLKQLTHNLHKWLWTKHGNDLYVAIDCVEFGFYVDQNRQFIKRIICLNEQDENLLGKLKEELKEHQRARVYFPDNDGDRKKFHNEWRQHATLGDLWWLLSEKLAHHKQRRWLDVLGNEPLTYRNLFERAEEGGAHGGEDREICAVTGRFAHRNKMDPIEEGSGIFVLKQVKKQIELGDKLHDADFIVLEPPGWKGTLPAPQSSIEIWGCKAHIYMKKGSIITIPEPGLTIWRLNDTSNFIAPKPFQVQAAASWGFYFYGGNKMPVVKTRLATFEEIAQIFDDEFCEDGTPESLALIRDLLNQPETSAEKGTKRKSTPCHKTWTEQGATDDETTDTSSDELWEIPGSKDATGENVPCPTTYLGILRCDVDNLGELFIYGLPPQNQSFSALSTLSWQLAWFFSGYINTLQASHRLFRRHIQIVYAGGDDVFAVGRWDVLLAFALLLRREFCAFVCERPDITLSAGLPFFKPKYPIQRAAHIAGEQEERAKKFCHNPLQKHLSGEVLGKDAITLLELSVGWNPAAPANSFSLNIGKDLHTLSELSFIMLNFTSKMVNLLQSGALAHGFLHLLNEYYLSAQQNHTITHIPDTSYQVLDISRGSPALRWLWHLTYQLARMRKPDPNHKHINDFLTKIQNFAWTGEPSESIPQCRSLPLLALASQLAILWGRLVRSKTSKNANPKITIP